VSRQVAKKSYFTFVGGLNTEAGYLTFPPNMWDDGDNIIPKIDGSVERRLAMNYETSASNSSNLDTSATKTTLAYGCWEWDNVGGTGGKNYIVVQRGRYLRFYSGSATALSGTEMASTFVIDLNTYKAPTYPKTIGTDRVQVASANGKLLVVSPATEPFLVEELTDAATAFTITTLTLRFRDFEGDGSDTGIGDDIDLEPVALSDPHKYNLFNQGWRGAHVDTYKTSQGVYPSNSQQWFLGKDTDDNFDAALLEKQEFGKSRAPQGHFILDAFSRDRASVSGIAGLTLETENYRHSAVAFFAGRAWFAGLASSKKIGGWVFFSQTGVSNDKFGNCYQDGDPTSEHLSDLIANDGGVVPIHGAGAILRLVAMDRGVLVLADNGVWFVTGTLDSGFSATTFEVHKITNSGCLSATSVVSVENQVLYFSTEGIFAVRPGEGDNLLVATSITDKSIASYYRAISALAKDHAVGKYHAEDKKVYWLYQASPNADATTNRFIKDKMLVLDARLGSFYTHTISPLAANSPYVMDAIVTRGRSLTSTAFDVYESDGDNQMDHSNNQVIEYFDLERGAATALKFFTVVPSGSNFTVTWSEWEDGTQNAANFMDWYDKDSAGITYSAYMITGYDLGSGQGGDRQLQATYLTVLMKRTETGTTAGGVAINASEVNMSSRWHFSDTDTSNKWTTARQIYTHRRDYTGSHPAATYDTGYPVIIVKHKIRGRGHAFQLKFISTAQKDFKIIGWSIPVANNAD
jgi:hypothetical protein